MPVGRDGRYRPVHPAAEAASRLPVARRGEGDREKTATARHSPPPQQSSTKPEVPRMPAMPYRTVENDVSDLMWVKIRQEAEKVVRGEPALASFIISSILAQPTLEAAITQ